jgi:hypothetical protein
MQKRLIRKSDWSQYKLRLLCQEGQVNASGMGMMPAVLSLRINRPKYEAYHFPSDNVDTENTWTWTPIFSYIVMIHWTDKPTLLCMPILLSGVLEWDSPIFYTHLVSSGIVHGLPFFIVFFLFYHSDAAICIKMHTNFKLWYPSLLFVSHKKKFKISHETCHKVL